LFGRRVGESLPGSPLRTRIADLQRANRWEPYELRDLTAGSAHQDDVGWRDVAVDDRATVGKGDLVKRGEALDDADADLEEPVSPQGRARLPALGEARADERFRHDVRLAVLARPDVQYLREVRV